MVDHLARLADAQLLRTGDAEAVLVAACSLHIYVA